MCNLKNFNNCRGKITLDKSRYFNRYVRSLPPFLTEYSYKAAQFHDDTMKIAFEGQLDRSVIQPPYNS